MPSVAPISSCVKPSTSCIRNTVRYPSGSPSIASASRTLRSGSASRRGTATGSACSSSTSRFPSPPGLPRPVVHPRNRDGAEPGGERRFAAEGGEPLEPPDERVLGVLGCEVPVAHHAVDEPVHSIHMRVIERALRLRIARKNPGDEIRLFHPAPESRGTTLFWAIGQRRARKGCLRARPVPLATRHFEY